MEVSLNEIGEIITGNTPSKSDTNFWNSPDICFIKPDVIAEDEITELLDSNEYISENARNKARIVNENSILVTCIGSIAKIGIVKIRECAFNQQINAIIPNKNIDTKYLCYCLQKSKVKLKTIANAPVVPIINKKQFGEFVVKIDGDISTQKKIANRLDCIQSVIKLYKIQLQKYDDLIKTRFIEMFGDPQINQFNWNKVNISKIIKGKVSNGYFAKRNDYCENGNVKVLGVANIVNRMYSNVKDLPRTNVTQKDISKFKVQYGDMLFCRSSLVAEGIGKASIIPKDIADNILFECHVIRLPLDLDQCVPEFMQVLSTTDYFRNQVIAQSKTATMTTIGQDGILKTNIILPPIYKQKEFELFVQQVDKSREEVKKSLEKTQLLYDSLMQKYFG